MRIAQISTMSSPVREDATGSVESLVWLLTGELTRMGHEVTVFGVEGSLPSSEFVVTLPGSYGVNGAPDDWHLCEWINLSRAIAESGRFDVLHSHAYLWGIPLEKLARAPMIHTVHIVPETSSAFLWKSSPRSNVTAISRHQWCSYPELHPVATIPHGVDATHFTFREVPDDYVCYLGRFTSGKGPLQAIAVAKSLGLRLLLAGPEDQYYRDHVEPLVDGQMIEYVGFLQGADRDRLLGGARALLYPIQYPESFGLVLVEAMLCGTPVVAMRLGAVPEIVDEGVTGYSVDTSQEFEHAVLKAFTLDRARIKQVASARFSVEQMAQGYASAYASVCKGNR